MLFDMWTGCVFSCNAHKEKKIGGGEVRDGESTHLPLAMSSEKPKANNLTIHQTWARSQKADGYSVAWLTKQSPKSAMLQPLGCLCSLSAIFGSCLVLCENPSWRGKSAGWFEFSLAAPAIICSFFFFQELLSLMSVWLWWRAAGSLKLCHLANCPSSVLMGDLPWCLLQI